MRLFNKKNKPSKHFKILSKKLNAKKTEAIEDTRKKHKVVTEWAKKKGLSAEEIVGKSARGLVAGWATSAIVISAGGSPSHQVLSKKINHQKEIHRDVPDLDVKTTIEAKEDVTPQVKNMSKNTNLYDEANISSQLTSILNIPVSHQLNGIRLNATYGRMGYESHLSRFPGDNLSTHFNSAQEYKRFSKASMAGGPGGVGYPAPSKKALTQKDIDREKYYLVAQTFLSPSWGSPKVKDWFRHRKMVVVNPKNGGVVIGVLEDAGPQPHTGSKFGGSPEVVEELELSKTGSNVLMYFVDDPNDQIPLGREGK